MEETKKRKKPKLKKQIKVENIWQELSERRLEKNTDEEDKGIHTSVAPSKQEESKLSFKR
jgi:hypothetical protein